MVANKAQNPNRRWMVNPGIQLRDERQFLNSNGLFAVHPKMGQNWSFDEVGFRLLCSLVDPMTEADAVARYLAIGRENSEEVTDGTFCEFLRDCINDGILIEIGAGESPEKRALCLDEWRDRTQTRYAPLSSPSLVHVLMTSDCNLACRHCCATPLARRTRSHELTACEWFEVLRQLDRAAVRLVKFGGGEPFLREDFMEVWEFAATQTRMATSILTNALLIDDQIVSTLGRITGIHGPRTVSIGVSVDGATPATHAWLRRTADDALGKTLRAIDLLVQNDIRVTITCCLHRRNVHEMDDAVEIALAHGVHFVNFSLIAEVGRATTLEEAHFSLGEVSELVEKVESLKSKYGKTRVDIYTSHYPFSGVRHLTSPECITNPNGEVEYFMPDDMCGAGTTLAAVSSSGEVYPCVETVGVVGEIRGHVPEQDILRIWRDGDWHFYRGGWRTDDLLVCGRCRLSKNCTTAKCRGYPAQTLGSLYAPHPECLRNRDELGIRSADVMAAGLALSGAIHSAEAQREFLETC